MNVAHGLLIGDRFRLLERIHVGTLGALWRAADRVPGKEAAVRLLDGRAVRAQELGAFEGEMSTATALRHRCAVRIYGVGRDSIVGPWVATELVDGVPLDTILQRGGQRGGPLDPLEALELIAELAGALAELHELGLTHGAPLGRAVLIQRSRSRALRPKLIGVGRARLLGARQTSARAGWVSPEEMASRPCTTASDVWSLGVLLFKCLTGHLPFTARAPTSFQSELRSIERVLWAIEDREARHIVAECLALAPEQRPSAAMLEEQADYAVHALRRRPRYDAPDGTILVEPVSEATILVEPVSEVWSEPVVPPAVPEAPPPVESESFIAVVAPPTERFPANALLPIFEPQPYVEAPPPAVEPEPVVPPRPPRTRAKLVIGGFAAAALVLEVIVATRGARAPGRVPREHLEAARTIEPSSAPSAAAAPAIVSSPPAQTVAAAVVTATAAASSFRTVAAKPAAPPPVGRTTPPRPAKRVDDDNPYE